MKMFTFCLIVIFLTIFTTLVFSENYPKLQLEGATTIVEGINNGVFYEDPENKILLIDFKEVSDKLILVQVTNEDKVILEDKVADLSDDSIYEVDLKDFAAGEYLITLTTANEQTIVNKFSVKDKD